MAPMAQAPSRTETRGISAVAKAFFTAAAAIPEPLRQDVVKGALAKIRGELQARKINAAAAKAKPAAKAPAKTAKASAAKPGKTAAPAAKAKAAVKAAAAKPVRRAGSKPPPVPAAETAGANSAEA